MDLPFTSKLDQDQDKRIYTVSQINREIRMILETRFAQFWIEGEVSNFKHHSSGHMYFSLKDNSSQIGAVFFSRYNRALKFQLKDGLKVIAFGRISLYEPRGQYQVYVERIEPKGVGALQLAFLQLKEKLEKEGLFDPRHKKQIPRFPACVGLVTSPTGAAIRDILNVIGRRFKNTRILLYPVKVQGEGAASEIAEAIGQMNVFNEADVLIVGRGGGSLEDLWAFNEEVVARAVFDSKIPVISAVGHEIDWTISDLVADLRAPTPSAAAELVVQNSEELLKRLSDFGMRMRYSVQNLLRSKRQKLQALTSGYAFEQPRILVDQFSQRLDEIFRQLNRDLTSVLKQKQHDLASLAGRLQALSPLAILSRGYSLTFSEDGSLVKTVRKIRQGEMIRTRLYDGTVESKITKIEKKENESEE
ncbi:MAG: exodeoxyribonuclease VII large subunit [Candidatus Omnitrophica bacterium]|nr:exodeoxyribonuclease VII large subunit [Candidatus Omnitrophota bacterium]